VELGQRKVGPVLEALQAAVSGDGERSHVVVWLYLAGEHECYARRPVKASAALNVTTTRTGIR
jgi:hypothetical protein